MDEWQSLVRQFVRRFVLTRAFRSLPVPQQHSVLSALIGKLVSYPAPPKPVPEVPFERRGTPPQALRGIEEDLTVLPAAVPAFLPPRRFMADGRTGGPHLGQIEVTSLVPSWLSPSQLWDKFVSYWHQLKGYLNDFLNLSGNLDALVARWQAVRDQADAWGLTDAAADANNGLADTLGLKERWASVEADLLKWLPTWQGAAETAGMADLTAIGALPVLPLAAIVALAAVIVFGGKYLNDYLRLQSALAAVENKVLTPEQTIALVTETREPGAIESVGRSVQSAIGGLGNPLVVAGVVGIALLLLVSRR